MTSPTPPAGGRPTPTSPNRVLRSALLLVVVLPLMVMVGLALWTTNLTAVLAALAGARWGILALSLGLHFVQYPLMALRWRLLLAAPAPRQPTVTEASGYLLIAHLFNLLIPGPAGEVAAAWLLRSRRGIPMADAMAAGAYGRLFGMLLIAIIPLAATWSGSIPGALDGLPPPLDTLSRGALLVGSLLALALWPHTWSRLVARLAPRPPGAQGRLARLMAAGLRFMGRFSERSRHIATTPSRLLVALLLSALVVSVNIAAFHLILQAMGISLSAAQSGFAFCLIVLGHTVSYGLPGSGNVTSPLVGLVALHGVLGVGETHAVAALFLVWAAFILQGVLALALAVPKLDTVIPLLTERGYIKART